MNIERELYLQGLPKKHSASGALFFNENNEILIVEPQYKKEWIFPGGVIENNESPLSAVRREVKEELGLDVRNFKLLCIDWKNSEKPDNYQFLFYGGVLSADMQSNIVLQDAELKSFTFKSAEDCLRVVSKSSGARLIKALEALSNSKIIYLENEEYV